MEFVIIFAVLALVGALIGQHKGRTGFGAILGFLLGPIGWLIVALMPSNEQQLKKRNPGPKQKKCPECAELVMADAKVCRYCGYRSPSAQVAQGTADESGA